MEIEQQEPPPPESNRLNALSNTCLVRPKATGIVSLIAQFALVIISALVSMFFFYHVGGYEYMSWNENSTILEPIDHYKGQTSRPSTRTELLTTTEGSVFLDDLFNGTLFDKANGNLEEVNATLGLLDIEQIPNTTVFIDFVNAELDMLELIRISTLVYLAMCICWLLSLLLLLLSIKFEILDLVAVNAMILTVSILYAFIHALFIAVLLYYQRDISWRTMAIVIGTVVILISTTIIGSVCLTLTISWYKYIVYMKNNEQCHAISLLTKCVKKNRRSQQEAEQAYALPQITRHRDIPYADDTNAQVSNFSNF